MLPDSPAQIPANARRWKTVTLVLLLAALAVFISRGPLRALSRSTDLRGPYASARAWLQGSDPFDLSNTRQIMAQASHGKVTDVTVSAYPPSAFPILISAAAWSWQRGVIVWLLLSTLLYGALLVALIRWGDLRSHSSRVMGFLAGALAFSPAQTGLSLGQPAVAACSMTLLGMFLAAEGSVVGSGLLVGAAIGLKPQIGGLGLIWLIFTRRPKACVATIACLALLWGIGTLRVQSISPDWIAEWRASVASMPALNYELTNPERFGPIHLGVLLQGVIADRSSARVAALALVAIPSAWWAWMMYRAGRRPDLLLSAGALLALGLLPVYHRPYDAIVLLALAAWGIRELGGRRHVAAVSMLAVLSLLMFPVPAALITAMASGKIPSAIANNPVWQWVVMPHQVWAVCAAAGLALWQMHQQQSVTSSE